jgi:ubiquinone/menaquinone biosynthesis C-methylase UbiE
VTNVELVSETLGNSNSNSVGQLFDRIAPTYNIINHLLSIGQDFPLHRKLAYTVDKNEKLRSLDFATDTGNVLISLVLYYGKT